MSTELASVNVPIISDDIPEELQTRYTYWKKNTKLLYDYLNTNTTKWPSLTCQFMPDLDTASDKHRLLLSSFTSSQLVDDEAVLISEVSTMKHIPWSSLSNFDMDEMEFKIDNQTKLPNKNLVETVRIQFPGGDCNRARYMPHNPDVIGTISSNGSVYILDRTKHGSNRPSLLGKTGKFEIELLNLEASQETGEALSIAWNWQKAGTLATSYANGDINIWDITEFQKDQPIMTHPTLSTRLDEGGTNEVSWMVHHTSILAAAGEGNTLGILDTRASSSFTPTKVNHHEGINTVQFNYDNDMLLGSADSQGTIHLWDMRDLTCPLKTFYHGDSVSTIQWNSKIPSIIASAGQNEGLVKIWDTVKQDPELLFVHGGHLSGVNDISWNLHDPWVICSVANDNSTHIWKPASNIVGHKMP
ncbi:HDR068Wp [Eremothecium sinecaudum]|uniref:HDR068Wp n=1 Tax=Eremothecium sinecaudum TaxID=45286 RepID=A0A0X8HSV6_9SACH|nr:HDR068Wp [Eremothecium sinecaudum]AMD20810.1 HDR068Wp [Eremothecium sinecaudum]